MQAAGKTVGFGFGAGVSIVFVATMDDIIYSNFRKNVMMPFHMATVKGASI